MFDRGTPADLPRETFTFLLTCTVDTGEAKSVDCVRVDGAGDEGPTHEEVQFYWTRRHLLKNKVATLITTRSSGSSFLNRVELQNGCLSRGHSGTFIPSTMAGSPMDPDTGAISTSKLQENMSLAVDAYIHRVNGCPCGETVINLYRGADSSEQQEIRGKLLIFLKGSLAKKKKLQSQDPTLFAEFQMIWKIRANHMVSGLPSYLFFLLCCYKEDCPHPRCRTGPHPGTLSWYPGGPPISHLPMPVPDPERLWGNSNCSSCKGFCSGHYKTVFVDVTDSSAVSVVAKPPSATLKQLFSRCKGKVSDEVVESAAKEVLLPPNECQIWLNHLQSVTENRRRGAQKAAETRKAKRSQASSTNISPPALTGGTRTSEVSPTTTASKESTKEECFCGQCGGAYEEVTEEPEVWIECGLCERWFHCRCEGISQVEVSEDDDYICIQCQQ